MNVLISLKEYVDLHEDEFSKDSCIIIVCLSIYNNLKMNNYECITFD